jgi:hypothetical protein
MALHVSSTCAHHQEVKIALHSLWYHHTYRWRSRAREINIQFMLYRAEVAVYSEVNTERINTARAERTVTEC